MKRLIASRFIANCDTKELKECLFWELLPENINEIMNLQESITSLMDNKDKYVPLTRDEFAFILNGGGVILGAFVENEFIGMYAILFPKLEENLGSEIGIPKKELDLVIHLESAFVLPAYRGNHLLFEMKKMALIEANAKRDWKYILATIHPQNYPSIQAHFSIHMYIVKLTKKYNDLWRYILLLNTDGPVLIDSTSSIEVNVKNTERQIQLLNEGYIGYKQMKKENETYMMFALPL